jgi:hypothetical protein
MILYCKFAEHFIGPALERMNGSAQRRENRAAFRHVNLAKLARPLEHVLKKILMNCPIVRRVESTVDGSGAQFFAALASRSVFESTEFVLRSKSGDVLQDFRARPEVGVPIVHRNRSDLRGFRPLVREHLPLALKTAFSEDRDGLRAGDFTPQSLLMNRFVLSIRHVALMLETAHNPGSVAGLLGRCANVFWALTHTRHYILGAGRVTLDQLAVDIERLCDATFRVPLNPKLDNRIGNPRAYVGKWLHILLSLRLACPTTAVAVPGSSDLPSQPKRGAKRPTRKIFSYAHGPLVPSIRS